MRILLVNKFADLRGGAERCFLDQQRWFEAAGHEVSVFSQAGASPPTRRQFAVPAIDYTSPRRPTSQDLGRFYWSHEVARTLERAVAMTRPGAAVLHNIYHHLGPAVPMTLKRLGVPMVMVLHDHKLICPAYSAWRAGSRCVECKGKWFHHAIQHSCGGSRAKSLVLATESFWQHRVVKSYRAVGRFVAPSAYTKATIESAGLGLQVALVRNAVDPVPLAHRTPGRSVGFAGRLAREKGLEVLLGAARRLPSVTFRVAGTGPEEASLRTFAAHHGLTNVVFLGHLSSPDLHREMQSWTLAVVPSLSPENCPYAVLDAMNLGIPVVGSDAAGIRELLLKRGCLFATGNVDELALRLSELLNDETHQRDLATAALRFVREECSPSAHVRAMVELLRSEC